MQAYGREEADICELYARGQGREEAEIGRI